MISLEADPKHAEVARRNIAAAGLDGGVTIRLGRAIETLPQLASEDFSPFDVIFEAIEYSARANAIQCTTCT